MPRKRSQTSPPPAREHNLPVRWNRAAALDLVAITRYIKQSSPQSAAEFLARARTRADDLSHFPRRGRVVPELERLGITEWREIIFSPYRLIYTVENDMVEVDALVDSRRDVEEFLLERLVRQST